MRQGMVLESCRIDEPHVRFGKERLGVDLSRAEWRKSSHSQFDSCVEVAFVDGHVAVRNSKDRQGAVLVFSPGEWQDLLRRCRSGELEAPEHP